VVSALGQRGETLLRAPLQLGEPFVSAGLRLGKPADNAREAKDGRVETRQLTTSVCPISRNPRRSRSSRRACSVRSMGSSNGSRPS